MDKVCDTCLYGIRVEGNKLGCRYPGICHRQDGEKTAWAPKKAQQYADLKGRRFRPTFSSNIDYFEIRGYDAERDMVLTTAHPKGGSAFDDEIEERYLAGAIYDGSPFDLLDDDCISWLAIYLEKLFSSAECKNFLEGKTQYIHGIHIPK